MIGIVVDGLALPFSSIKNNLVYHVVYELPKSFSHADLADVTS